MINNNSITCKNGKVIKGEKTLASYPDLIPLKYGSVI